ncbi:aspartate-semialdehyde dehydrogenase [Candidatus Bathyarchaeota archaeon]|nr:MAG: aspartate-semialdehyde dehydrogenase [Candidatus Bathyarchaeota archaeon]
MMKAAVLGATGSVGQIFIQLLNGHPWFEVSVVAASERSAGLKYSEAAKWRLPTPIPENVSNLEVVDIEPKAVRSVEDVDVVFSALPSDVAGKTEESFAEAGYFVVSNASAHRMDPDVPLLNPEVNCDHVSLIDEQRRRRKWSGAIVTNPNCSATVLTLSMKPIYDEFGIERMIVSTMQAISGAGYPGVASLDIVDNVIPFIKNEEEKMQIETLKIFGSPSKPADFKISASCHRVPTLDGHMEAVFIETKREADPESVMSAMEKFMGEPQRLKLPTAPANPIVVKHSEDRPQTRLDRMEGGGMSVVVGRVRKDSALKGIKYIVLGHNTIRGAAGCGVLNAEYLKAKKYI